MRAAVRFAGRTAQPLARASRAARRHQPLTVLGWHRIGGPPDDALSTPADVFLRQLDALQGSGACVLPLSESVRMLASEELPDRAVALTFDDGYASVLDVAWPLLRERGLPATLFVVTDYLDGIRRFPWDADRAGDHTRLAGVDEIRTAARAGLDIGSHTVTHRWLPHLPAGELAGELTNSRHALEGLLDRPVRSVAYPAGGWDLRVRSAAAEAGYTVGVTVDRGTNPARQDRLTLRRAFAPDTVRDFELVLDGAYTWLRPVDRWRTRNGPRW